MPVGKVPKGHRRQTGFAVHMQLSSWLQNVSVSHLLRAVSTRQAWIKFREANSQLMKPTSDVVINANLGPGLGVRDSGN